MASKDRYRNWLFITYPESLPDNWKQYIEEVIQVPLYVSPLHDRDQLPDGTFKKPHFHNLITFSGVKTFDQVQELISPLNGTIPIPCNDIGGSLRYFVHLDNPDKFKYEVKDVQCFGGADYLDAIFTISDDKRMKREIKQFIVDHNILLYSDLSLYGSMYNQEWENCIDRNSIFWVSFIKSLQYKENNHIYSYIDELESFNEKTN